MSSRNEKPLKLNASMQYNRVPEDLKRDEAAGLTADAELVKCGSCGRNFRKERLEKHQAICEKSQQGAQRRGVFSSSARS